ncbi:hypothetical protein N9917_04040 [Deltaproteobacteria bacterium]|nr:hypothetical protein [Deltaproteobacteria bacterium]
MKERLRKDEWHVRECLFDEAKRLIIKHHYAKGGSNTRVYTHGLYNNESGVLHGVAWWLPPTRVAAESVNKEEWKKVLSLTRLAMIPETPKNACSFLLAKSCRLIKDDGRFVSLVTYADEFMSHEGGIYKASNWEYIGKTGPYTRWESGEGRQVAVKATKSRTKKEMLALGHKQTGRFFKHKYVLHL